MNKQIERQTIRMDSINEERKRRMDGWMDGWMDKEHLSKQNMHKFKEKYQSIKMYPCLSHITYL